MAACRRRYHEKVVDVLCTKARAGRPPKISRGKKQPVVAATLDMPKNVTHWSMRRLSREVEVTSATRAVLRGRPLCLYKWNRRGPRLACYFFGA